MENGNNKDNVQTMRQKNTAPTLQALMNSALLLLIEQLFSDGNRDQEAIQKVNKLDLPVVLAWEQESATFRDGLARSNWWEQLFSSNYPTTYERLKRSAGRRSNALALLFQIRIMLPKKDTNVWRSLFVLLIESNRIDRGVWSAGRHDGDYSNRWQTSIHHADEFGIDQIHLIHPGRSAIRAIQLQRDGMKAHTFEIASPALMSLGQRKEQMMQFVCAWTVPFQQAVVMMLECTSSKDRELVWIPTHQRQLDRDFELSNWAINHNNLTENPEDFAAPPFLHGDKTLSDVIVASTEGRVDIPNVRTAMTAVVIRHRDVMVFDQLQQQEDPTKKIPPHWRRLLTNEVFEHSHVPVLRGCMVLDAFFLYASSDGSLKAHPRGNMLSTYYVENLHSGIPHLSALYNVVAIMHSYSVLEVRRVEKQDDDPFLRFTLLYRTQMVDSLSPPVLYGPYVIFRSIDDGNWYRVLYDTPSDEKPKDLIKVPFKAGWRIVSVKNANWRFWTVVLRNSRTGEDEEHLLFAGGLQSDTSTRPFLVASCIECGTRAKQLCGNCLNVGFCLVHGEDHEHSYECK
jgi:hypothetical protein